MKNLKFKAWIIPQKRMIDVYGFNQNFVFAKDYNSPEDGKNIFEIDDCILLQFTGLKDVKNNDIYDRDIIKTTNNIVSVFFGKHISYVTMLGKKDTIETNGWLVKNAKGEIDVLDESFCNGEKICNFYENPELLK